MSYSVALGQIQPKLGCVTENFNKIEAVIEKGIQEKASLILFPELAATGYFLRDLVPDVALSLDSPQIAHLKDLSRHISIAFGFVEVSSEYRFFNSALYLEDGSIKHLHRKVYLPTYGLFDEQRYLAKGDRYRAFDTRLGRMGLLICEDMWHLSAPYILVEDGATSLICLSSSPGRGITDAEILDSTASWQKITSTFAMVLNCHVLFCNRVGYEDGVCFWGGSEAVNPSGAVNIRGRMFEEDCVIASIDEGALRRDRIFAPIMRDENLFLTVKELQRIERERDC